MFVRALVAAALLAPAHWTGPAPAGAPDRAWWNSLHGSGGGSPCCDVADGRKVADVDWDTGGPGGQYRVRVDGRWVVVPPGAVVTAPNMFGLAVAWPFLDQSGTTQIRCFMPGSGT